MNAELKAGRALASGCLLAYAVPPDCRAFPPNSYVVGSLSAVFSSQLSAQRSPSARHLHCMFTLCEQQLPLQQPFLYPYPAPFLFFSQHLLPPDILHVYILPLILPPPLEQALPVRGTPFCPAHCCVPCCGRSINLCCDIVTEIQFLPAFPLV